MSLMLIKIIRVYQIMLSVFVGQHCRFSPTCSNYALEALEKKGLVVGLFLLIKRIIKCNPFSKGGHDPVK